MKLFRHYKNQFYRFRGIVRHSETEEELVLYETRYACASGRDWVRPKDLFFGTIQTATGERSRFEALNLRVHRVTDFAANDYACVMRLCVEIFGDGAVDEIEARIGARTKPLLVLGFIEAEPVAFKLGYADDDGAYYSWLGGVLKEFRGLGYAMDLLRDQHEWAREQGFARIRTKTMNQWREMLLLNLRAGFQITGTEAGARGLKIVLEKDL